MNKKGDIGFDLSNSFVSFIFKKGPPSDVMKLRVYKI